MMETSQSNVIYTKEKYNISLVYYDQDNIFLNILKWYLKIVKLKWIEPKLFDAISA